MKKIISVSILLFFFSLLTAQNKDQTKKQVIPAKKAQVKTQTTASKKVQVKKAPVVCNWQKNESDPFTGKSEKTTVWEIVGYDASTQTSPNNEITGVYHFAISQKIEQKDTSYMLLIRTSTSQIVCFNQDSKILCKSGESIVTISLTGGTVCGKSITSNGILDRNARNFLQSHPIDLLRIQFSGENNTIMNEDLSNSGSAFKLESDYFIKTLRCFE